MSQRVQINASPHAGQRRVHDDPARFKVLACGRRWGKTRLGVHECLDVASQGGRAWWVSPSYKTSEVGWRPLRDIGARAGAEIRKVDRQINLSSGGSVTVRSADNPDSLRGEGLDFVVMDECAFIAAEAWIEALRPSLADRQGRAMFISTPKGHNWFWQLWQRGQDAQDGEWASWTFPTSDNPYIAAEEIEAARAGSPERIYRQEYLAEFIDDAGGVFRRVMDAATATPQDEPIAGHAYAIGVDWGRHNDFTALTVLDVTTKEVVYVDRFTQIDYGIQISRLKALYDRFKPGSIEAEQNSMGEPLIEQLRRDGLPVRGFQTTNSTKELAIRALEGAFERDQIRIINDPVLIGELQSYEQEQLPAGRWRFTAPEGMHDDYVMSLAIVWYAVAAQPPPASESFELDSDVFEQERVSVWD
jgi:hypothetical protein